MKVIGSAGMRQWKLSEGKMRVGNSNYFYSWFNLFGFFPVAVGIH